MTGNLLEKFSSFIAYFLMALAVYFLILGVVRQPTARNIFILCFVVLGFDVILYCDYWFKSYTRLNEMRKA